MGARKKLQFQGQEVWGEEVEYQTDREGWNEYILEDGTKLKMKAVVSNVYRLEIYKPDGEPVYLVQSTNLVSADVPDRLKQKGGGDS